MHPFVELRTRLIEIDALAALGDPEGSRAALVRAHARLLVLSSKIGDEAVRKTFLPWHARILRLATERLVRPF